jgi:hypothetical protein
MCLPTKTDEPPQAPAGSGARSLLGMGGLMLLACLGGPALLGALGGLGADVLLGAGGAVFAFALCAAAPAVTMAWRRRSCDRHADTGDAGAGTGTTVGALGAAPAATKPR